VASFFGCFKSINLTKALSIHPSECPDFAELDVLLGQHILLTLEQHFKQKI